jgi:hypothetical protein
MNVQKRSDLLLDLVDTWQMICRLNIDLVICHVGIKIILQRLSYIVSVFIFLTDFNNSDIDMISSVDKFIENDISHHVRVLQLPEVQTGISEPVSFFDVLYVYFFEQTFQILGHMLI